MKTKNKQQLKVKSAISAGLTSTPGQCYNQRDGRTTICTIAGWPQNNADLPYCAGNTNEQWLKKCLYDSGDKTWWKAFDGCTDSYQCLIK